MSDMPPLPDQDTQAKLQQAAEIITKHLDKALEECVAQGLDREHFTAGVLATMMQAMETSLGSAAAGALQEMATMAADHKFEEVE